MLALILLIVVGNSVLTSVVNTALSIVSTNEQAYDQQKYNKAVEQITQGENIYYDIITNYNHLQINIIAIKPIYISSIISVILELIKAVPEAVNTIKQFIDSNGIKVDKSKILSDEKLNDKSINFVRTKIYDISM